jgi:hypothetical protein
MHPMDEPNRTPRLAVGDSKMLTSDIRDTSAKAERFDFELAHLRRQIQPAKEVTLFSYSFPIQVSAPRKRGRL